MRKTKFAAGALLLLFIALAAILYIRSDGGRSRYKVSVLIRAEAPAIHEALTQPKRLRLWLKGYKRSIPLDDLGTRVGARSREIMEVNGRRFEMRSTLTAVEPGRLLAIKLEHADMDSFVRYEIAPDKNGHAVTIRGETQFKNFPEKLLASVITPSIIKVNRENLAALRRLLEKESSQR